MNFKFTRRKIFAFILIFVLIMVAYLAADRYLIQHVEISNVNAYVESVSSNGSATAVISSTSTTPTVTRMNTTPIPQSSKPTTTKSLSFSNGDWNYKSDDLSISIKKVVTGSGTTKVTYFVADVSISQATQLMNAFANNQFGKNIIAYTSTIAKANGALFAINGDYYGFRSDGIIIRNGVIFRDKPARIGLELYRDGSMRSYDEKTTTAQQLVNAGVWNTLSFGPALIENSTITANLDKIEVDTNFGNHSIQGNEPRTGIGLISNNHFVFIVVDGRSNGYSRGVTLVEFAQIFKDLGCTHAYNIDGGGSSTMFFNGSVINNPLGKNQERGTSDILFIAP